MTKHTSFCCRGSSIPEKPGEYYCDYAQKGEGFGVGNYTIPLELEDWYPACYGERTVGGEGWGGLNTYNDGTGCGDYFSNTDGKGKGYEYDAVYWRVEKLKAFG